MGQKNFRNSIRNPFSAQSTLSNVEKIRGLLRGGLSFTTIIIKVVFLLILAYALVGYFRISLFIAAMLIGTEVLATLIAGYFIIKMMRAINQIETQDNAPSYRRILVISAYYGLMEAVCGLMASGIIFLIFSLFSQEISNAIIQIIRAYIPANADWPKYLVFLFVIFRSSKFIMKLISYHWIKNIRESNDFAQINRELELIKIKLQSIIAIPGISIVLIIIPLFIDQFLVDIPFYIILFYAGFAFVMFILFYVAYQRIRNIRFDNQGIDASAVQHKIGEYDDEQIAGWVFGIIKVAASFRDIFKPAGTSVLGSGKRYFPENTLLVTNYRLLLIQIPISGGNKIVGDTDYVHQNFYFNRAELRQKGEEILKTNSLPQILRLATNDILYRDIKTLTLKQNYQIIVEKMTGQKLSYSFGDKEYFDSLKRLFQFYLKGRFVQK